MCSMYPSGLEQGKWQEGKIGDGKSIRILGLTGRGAFSSVYRAWDEDKQRIVACKVSDDKEMLRREEKMLARIKHPLFVKVIAYFEQGEKGILVSEFIEGTCLEQLLQRRGQLSFAQTRRIGKELAEGLRYLHELESPIIYRDLKPENIIIRQDGGVKLIDFGCAGANGDGAVAGTKGFAAPELMLENSPCSPCSDVYCLGRVLQVMCRDAPGSGWERFLDFCTRQDIRERAPDMRYVLHELAAFEKHHGTHCFEKEGLEGFRCKKNICLF